MKKALALLKLLAAIIGLAYLVLLLVVAILFGAGCGHDPEPIGFIYDIWRTPKTETAIVITGLSLRHWPKLQKFTELEHLRVFEQMAPQITDEHLKTLSRLNMPKLRDMSFAYCSQVTDNGIRALTNLPAIKSLQLIGVGITDEGLKALATGLPHLEGVNVEDCPQLTMAGFLSLTNPTTITSLSLSLEPLSQAELEQLISTVNMKRWSIRDRHHKLDRKSLGRLGDSRGIIIDVVDENNFSDVITQAPQQVMPQYYQ